MPKFEDLRGRPSSEPLPTQTDDGEPDEPDKIPQETRMLNLSGNLGLVPASYLTDGD